MCQLGYDIFPAKGNERLDLGCVCCCCVFLDKILTHAVHCCRLYRSPCVVVLTARDKPVCTAVQTETWLTADIDARSVRDVCRVCYDVADQRADDGTFHD